MKIHEHQARDILADAGVNVPSARVITNASDAADAYTSVLKEANLPQGSLAVVKAQVFAGGRGKAGFVKLVHSAKEATDAASFMLANRMVSKQTGPAGLDVNTILIAAGVDIAHEYYLAITTDRSTKQNVLIASSEGGVEIEEVAAKNPDAIKKQHIHPTAGLQPHQARRLAFELGFTGKQVNQAVKIMLALANLYTKLDCTIAEINPLITTKPTDAHPDGQVIAIDAKFNFDDNALFRQKSIAQLKDSSEDNPNEIRADKAGLSYIALDGTIGCLVNGAGLAMATMDITKHFGGSPANFLDVGGSATEESVTEAFRIILDDKKVEGVLVNIFGGIMSCAVIAQAVANAAKEVGFTVPLVVRLEGTDVDEGRRILEEAKTDIPTMQSATDIADAAQKVCAAVA